MSDPSLAELRAVAKATGMSIQLELLEYRAGDPNPGLYCELIDRAIDQCAVDMARFPKETGDQSEDQLSIMLILQLKRYGFSASHDATSGGHCDIVIEENPDLLWLGEAKKVTGKQNAHISSGYDQLMDRYSTGLPSQDKGALVIFCNAARIDEILESWSKHLVQKYEGVEIELYDKDNVFFRSRSIHHKTGRQYNVRHKPISVFFAPKHGDAAKKA